MVLHLFVSTFEIAVKVQNELKRKNGGDEFDACILYVSCGDRVHVSVLSNRHRLCGDDRFITFNKTVFCNTEPSTGSVNDTCTVRFSVFAVNFDVNQSRVKSGREKEIGIASLFCSPLDIAAASKAVIFYDRSSQHIVGRLAVALQYKNAAEKSPSKSRTSLPRDPREVAFLLSREMRRSNAARRSFPISPHRQDRVTFDDTTERIVRQESRRNNFSSLLRSRTVEPTASPSPSAEKRLPYDRRRKSSPKLRNTAMSVGYVKNKWPDVSESIMEKSMYRLHLSEQRRLALLQEVEQQIHKRRKAREQHAQRIKEDNLEGQANAVALKSLLKKKEKEVQQLMQKLRLMQQESILSAAKSKSPKKFRSGEPKAARKEPTVNRAQSDMRSGKNLRRRSATDKESASTPTPVGKSTSGHQSKLKMSKLKKAQNDVKVTSSAKSSLSRRYQSSAASASSLSDDISLSDYDSAEGPTGRPRTDWLAPARASIHSLRNQSPLKSFDHSINSAMDRSRESSSHANNDTPMSSRRFYSYQRVGGDVEGIADGDRKKSSSEESSMAEIKNSKNNFPVRSLGWPIPLEGVDHNEQPSRSSYSSWREKDELIDPEIRVNKNALAANGGSAESSVPIFLNSFLGQRDQRRFNHQSDSDSDSGSDGAEITYGATIDRSYPAVESSVSSSGTYSSPSTGYSPKFKSNNISVEEISFISSQPSEFSYAVDHNLHHPVAQYSFSASKYKESSERQYVRQVGYDFVDERRSDVSGKGKTSSSGMASHRPIGDRESASSRSSTIVPSPPLSSSSSSTATSGENPMQLPAQMISKRVELTESNIRAREAFTATRTVRHTAQLDSVSQSPAAASKGPAEASQDSSPSGHGRDIEGRLNDQLSDIGNAIESLEARIDVFMQSVPKPPRPSGLTMAPQPVRRSSDSVSSTRSLSPDSLRL